MSNAFDLHEIIFSRGDVQGADEEVLLAIHDRSNCGWIHRKCHQYGEGGEGRMRGISYLLRYEGMSHVMEFVTDISNQLTVGSAHHVARMDVLAVLEKMEEHWKTLWPT